MRVLLKGGVWHDKVVNVRETAYDLLVPVPVPPALLVKPDVDALDSMLKTDRYMPSRFEGYVPGSTEVLPIWEYVGEW